MAVPGNVIHLRVNPKDSMSVIDTLNYLGIPPTNMSFAQAVSIVLKSSLRSFREQGFIPDRTGFEYNELMAPFVGRGKVGHNIKVQITKLTNAEDFNVAPVLPEDHDHKRRRLRYEELLIKKENDPINFGEEEQVEFRPLLEEFYQS